jgi:hypothetical protein
MAGKLFGRSVKKVTDSIRYFLENRKQPYNRYLSILSVRQMFQAIIGLFFIV